MSRCTMPERCAVSMALASLMPVLTASATDIGLTRTRDAEVGRRAVAHHQVGPAVLHAVTPAVITETM